MKSVVLLLIIVLATGSGLLYGQEQNNREIIIDGVIISKEDSKPVPFVHIINTNTMQGVVSNLQGRFVLKMKSNDSIVFSAIGFDKFVFKLREGLNVSRLDITIEMNESSMELEPVRIFAYKDVRALKHAILETEVETEPDKTRMQLPGFYYGPRKEIEPTALGNPLSYIYNKVSKRAKEERKYKQLEVDYDAWRNNVFRKYNPALVQELTGLPEEKVEEFMRFCKIDDRFVKLSAQYEVRVAINKCLEDYLGDTRVDLDND